MDSSLEKCGCNLCGSSYNIKTYYNFNPYVVSRCRNCGLWFLSTRLKEAYIIKSYENDEYFKGVQNGYQNYEDQEKSLKMSFSRFFKRIKNLIPPNACLLEIGCGYGYLLEAAKPYFAKCYGTEFSKNALERASKHANKVYQGSIVDVPKEETFDFIIMTQVIEHVYSPVDFMKKALERLNPGGIIIVTTPNIGSIWFKIMGKKWASFKIPEHVSFYDRRTLYRLLHEAGCKDVIKVPFLHAFPLSLAANKIGICVRGFMETINLWIPGTTIAMAGKKLPETLLL